MKVLIPVAALVVATVFLTVSLVASFLAPPSGMDSRDGLVVAVGACGVALLILATRRFFRIHRALPTGENLAPDRRRHAAPIAAALLQRLFTAHPARVVPKTQQRRGVYHRRPCQTVRLQRSAAVLTDSRFVLPFVPKFRTASTQRNRIPDDFSDR